MYWHSPSLLGQAEVQEFASVLSQMVLAVQGEPD